jgi:hypothetical protein
LILETSPLQKCKARGRITMNTIGVAIPDLNTKSPTMRPNGSSWYVPKIHPLAQVAEFGPPRALARMLDEAERGE